MAQHISKHTRTTHIPLPAIIVLVLIAALALWSGISLIMSAGLPNLLIRNALAFDLDIEDPGFSGASYEHVPYAAVSEADYLDLYVPDAESPMPLVICVHGGGFVYNNSQSRQARLIYQYLRNQGYAVASVNYRLADEALYPAAICDVKAAVRFLRANAEYFGYNGDKIAIWGESAGGYLAAMAAFSDDDMFSDVASIGENENEKVSGKVSACLDFYGVMDFDKTSEDFIASGVPVWLGNLTTSGNVFGNSSHIDSFLGRSVSSLSEAELEEMSPTHYAALLQEGELKVFITHGSVDITVARAQSWRLRDTLEVSIGAANVTYIEQLNFKHADDRFYTPEALSAVKYFLDTVFA